MKLTDIIVEKEEVETGTFVGARFSDKSCDILLDIMKQLGLENPTEREDLHTTVMYTLKSIPDFAEDNPEPVTFDPPKSATIDRFQVFPSQDGDNALVLVLKSKYLSDRHNEIIDTYGAEYTHDEYHPHVTLAYSPDEFDVDNWDITDYAGDLELITEYNSPLDPDWK